MRGIIRWKRHAPDPLGNRDVGSGHFACASPAIFGVLTVSFFFPGAWRLFSFRFGLIVLDAGGHFSWHIFFASIALLRTRGFLRYRFDCGHDPYLRRGVCFGRCWALAFARWRLRSHLLPAAGFCSPADHVFIPRVFPRPAPAHCAAGAESHPDRTDVHS